MTFIELDDQLQTVSVEVDDKDELQQFYKDRDLTDGLPIIIPTEERVDAFIERSGFDPNRLVGAVEPVRGVATVRNVAVNAVMAGCRPEALGVVLAAVEAITQDAFKLRGVQTTTNPVTPLIIVNGPVRGEVGVASGRNALGPGQSANGPIGRAVRFVMRNIGGAIGTLDLGTLGTPAKYTYCLGEAEEVSPWEPLHVALGYDASESVVTVVGVESFIDTIPCFYTADAILDFYSIALRNPGSNVWWSQANCVMVINPGHAEILAGEGLSRSDIQQRLFDQGSIPLESLPYGNIPMGEWTVREGRVLVVKEPSDIYVMVAGGPEPWHSVYMTGFGLSEAVSRKVWTPATERDARAVSDINRSKGHEAA